MAADFQNASKKMLFHDSQNSDRVYTSFDWSKMFVEGLVVDSGPLEGFSQELEVIAQSPANYTIRIQPGVAFIAGRKTQVEGSEVILSIDTAAIARTDIIVVREDNTSDQRLVSYAVIQGTDSGSPTDPTLTFQTNDDGIREIPLARVNIVNGQASIQQSDIDDIRDFAKFSSGMLPSIISTFLELSDTPSSYSGRGQESVRVAETEDGLEFFVPDNNTNTGILEGMFLDINGGDSAKFDISSGTYFIVDNTNIAKPETKRISFAGQTAIITDSIALQNITHIGINEAGDIIQSPSDFTTKQQRTIAKVGILAHFDKTVINAAMSTGISSGYQTVLNALDIIGPKEKNLEGNKITANSGGNLNIDITNGQFVGIGINRANDPDDPNRTQFSSEIPATFRYVYRDGANDLTFGALTNDIDPNNFDNGSGTLGALAGNEATNQWIYRSPRTGSIFIFYGQTVYSNLDEANLAKRTGVDELAGIPDDILNDLVPISILSVRNSATDLTDSNFADFADVTGTGAGGSVGGGTITSLDDVDIINTSADSDVIAFGINQQKVNEGLMDTITEKGQIIPLNFSGTSKYFTTTNVALKINDLYSFRIPNNGDASQAEISVNGEGTYYPVVDNDGVTALSGNEIKNKEITFFFDGTSFVKYYDLQDLELQISDVSSGGAATLTEKTQVGELTQSVNSDFNRTNTTVLATNDIYTFKFPTTADGNAARISVDGISGTYFGLKDRDESTNLTGAEVSNKILIVYFNGVNYVRIVDATKWDTQLANIEQDISNILDGTSLVGRAQKDQNDNVIDTTYDTKSSVDSKVEDLAGASRTTETVYQNAQDIAARLLLAGGTMSGNILMGNNLVRSLAAPTDVNDATRKVYVDDEIKEIEGVGRTTETIKQNADDVQGIKDDLDIVDLEVSTFPASGWSSEGDFQAATITLSSITIGANDSWKVTPLVTTAAKNDALKAAAVVSLVLVNSTTIKILAENANAVASISLEVQVTREKGNL
jgi:hypothetical protein